jgi:hypothetical protein
VYYIKGDEIAVLVARTGEKTDEKKILSEVSNEEILCETSLSLSLSYCSHLEHGAYVKRFVSLQFLNPKTIGRTPWTGDQPVARPLPIQDNTNIDIHPCLKWDSNPRSQCSSEIRQFMP